AMSQNSGLRCAYSLVNRVTRSAAERSDVLGNDGRNRLSYVWVMITISLLPHPVAKPDPPSAVQDAIDRLLVPHGTSLRRWSFHVRRGRRALTPARAGEVRGAGSARRVDVKQEVCASLPISRWPGIGRDHSPLGHRCRAIV